MSRYGSRLEDYVALRHSVRRDSSLKNRSIDGVAALSERIVLSKHRDGSTFILGHFGPLGHQNVVDLFEDWPTVGQHRLRHR